MSDETNTSSAGGNSLAERLASIIGETAIKAPSPKPAAPVAPAEWHFIHAGKETGPFAFAELVEKAAAGEIDADDLVKPSGGMWTKARDFPSLQEQFRLKQVAQEKLENSATRVTDLDKHPGGRKGPPREGDVSLPITAALQKSKWLIGFVAFIGLALLGAWKFGAFNKPLTPEQKAAEEQKARVLKHLDDIAERLIQRGLMENTGTPAEKREKVRQIQARQDALNATERVQDEVRRVQQELERKRLFGY